MKCYLIGGGDIKKGELEEIDREALANAKNRQVYVLDLTSNNKEKLARYRKILKLYFEKLGADKVGFISNLTSFEQVNREIRKSGLVYIPGGDTETLIHNIKKHNLESILPSLAFILVGNSAGALAMCKEVILTKGEDIKEKRVLAGANLVPFSVDVHYDETHDKELFELSKERDIYAIPEKCAIVYNTEINFFGNIWKFSKGKKEKVN